MFGCEAQDSQGERLSGFVFVVFSMGWSWWRYSATL